MAPRLRRLALICILAAPLLAAAPTQPATPTTRPTRIEDLPQRVEFAVNDAVEYKWADFWEKGTVAGKRPNGWYLITYSPDKGSYTEWVEWWRLRKPGTTDDLIGTADPHPVVRKGAAEPVTPDPGPPAGANDKEVIERRRQWLAEQAMNPVLPNRGTVKAVPFPTAPVKGKFTPDPEVKPAQLSDQPVQLAVTGHKTDGLFFNGGGGGPVIALVGYRDPFDNEPFSRCERIDLAAGKSLGLSSVPFQAAFTDISPDGRRVIATSKGVGRLQPDRLCVWNVEAPDAAPVVTFRPYGTLASTFKGVHWARFVDDQHVATMSDGDHEVCVWDLTGRLLWHMTGASGVVPALSGTRKQIALLGRDGMLTVVDAMTGASLVAIASQPVSPGRVAFRPDGRQLALAGVDLVRTWDLVEGKTLDDISPMGTRALSLAWLADRYLMVDGARMISLDLGITAWRYHGINVEAYTAAGAIGYRYFYVHAPTAAAKPALTLASAALPDAAATAALAKVTPESIAALGPGGKVTLEVNLPDDIKPAVTKALTAKLAANGVTVAPEQPLKFVADFSQGKDLIQVGYHNEAGTVRNTATTKIKIRSVVTLLRVVDDSNTVLWQRYAPKQFGEVVVKRGQTLDEAVAKASLPTADFYVQTPIPKYIPKLMKPAGLGFSALTETGVAPAAPGAEGAQ